MTLCLVTGGAGFIGSSLARALVARGDRVRVIDNFSSGKRENLADIADRIELVEGDILDDRALGAGDRGRRAGVSRGGHPVGAEVDGRADREPRRQRHRHAARPRARAGAPAIRRLVYAASSAAYGDDPALPKVETMPPAPISPYGGSKLAGEQYAQIYARAYGLETVCLRYFNVFGPRQDPAVRVRGGDPQVHHRRAGGQAAAHLRRRHAVARLLLHRQRRRGELQGGRGRRQRRLGRRVQHRLRAGDRSEPGGGADRRLPGQEAGGRSTRTSGRATSSTPGPTSRRPGRASATRRPSRSPKGWDGRSTGINRRGEPAFDDRVRARVGRRRRAPAARRDPRR